MEDFINTIKDWARDNRASIDRERERLELMNEQQVALEQLLGRITQLENERDDLMRERDEQEALATRMRDERDRMAKEKDLLNLKLKELGMMTSKVVKKTDHDDLIDVLRRYMKSSKRKDIRKRGYIKMVIFELVTHSKLELPDDMVEELETFDDAEAETAVSVNAQKGSIVQVTSEGINNNNLLRAE